MHPLETLLSERSERLVAELRSAGLSEEIADRFLDEARPELVEAYLWSALDLPEDTPARPEDVLPCMRARSLAATLGLTTNETWAGLRVLVPAALEDWEALEGQEVLTASEEVAEASREAVPASEQVVTASEGPVTTPEGTAATASDDVLASPDPATTNDEVAPTPLDVATAPEELGSGPDTVGAESAGDVRLDVGFGLGVTRSDDTDGERAVDHPLYRDLLGGGE